MSEPIPPASVPHPYTVNEVQLVLDTDKWMNPYHRDLMKWLLDALAVECEACARAVEAINPGHGSDANTWYIIALEDAVKAIRARAAESR
jgi:hypothetical protein